MQAETRLARQRRPSLSSPSKNRSKECGHPRNHGQSLYGLLAHHVACASKLVIDPFTNPRRLVGYRMNAIRHIIRGTRNTIRHGVHYAIRGRFGPVCCCIGSACTVTTQANCTGNWLGAGTVCSPNPCPQPTGACCFHDGSCQILTSAACAGQGGTYQGNGTSCSPNPCPQPTGACCFQSGDCVVTSSGDCASQQGQYQGNGTVCDPNPCPQPPKTGACCLASGECVILTQAECGSQQGSYQGDNVTCDPNPCQPPV